jgi:FolB domain-containing protein
MNAPEQQPLPGSMGGDRIEIKDLLVRGIVGINENERRKRQDILINLSLLTDVRASGETDDIDDTVNYRTVTKNIIRMVEDSAFFTVEKLATEVARLVLEDDRVAEVTVTLEKPGALRFARSVGVTIRRTRNDFTS